MKLDPTHSVRMYHKAFDYHTNTVFGVVASEATLVPASHTRILPAHIPLWNGPPVSLNAVLQPQSEFFHENTFSVPNKLFNYSYEVIPIASEKKADSHMTIYSNTILGFFEVIPDGLLNGFSPTPKALTLKNFSKNCVRLPIQLIPAFQIAKIFRDLIQDFKHFFKK